MGYRGSWGQDPRFSTTGGTHGTTAGGTGRVSEGLESGMGGKLGEVLGGRCTREVSGWSRMV